MALYGKDILEYGGTAEELIWKSDVENFSNNTRVVVRPSQEAIFFSGGQMSDTLREGTHQLKSQNQSGFLRNLFGGGKPSTTTEVYFFNLAVVRPIEWGTREQVEILDPVYKIPIRVGAGGTMHIRIGNSRKLLEKLVGMQRSFTRAQMDDFFRGVMASCVGHHLSDTLSESQYNLFQFSRETKRLSHELLDILAEEFSDYGLILEKFFLDRIQVNRDDEEKLRKIIQAHGEAKVEDSLQNQRDMQNAIERGKIGVIKAANESDILHIQADALAYKTTATGHAENQVEAEKWKFQAETNKALGMSEQERRAFNVLEKIAKNTDVPSSQIHLRGTSVFGMEMPGMEERVIETTGGNAAAAVEGVRTILNAGGQRQAAQPDGAERFAKTDSSGDSEDQKRKQEYKRERDFLKEDLDEGIITREEYIQELSKLRDKYARM